MGRLIAAAVAIEQVDDARTLNIGSSSLVEQFKDPLDYSRGLTYTVSAGDRFTIPLTASWRRR